MAEFEVCPQQVDGLLPQAQDIDLSQYLVFDKAYDRALLGKSISQVRFHINFSETFARKEVTSTTSSFARSDSRLMATASSWCRR